MVRKFGCADLWSLQLIALEHKNLFERLCREAEGHDQSTLGLRLDRLTASGTVDIIAANRRPQKGGNLVSFAIRNILFSFALSFSLWLLCPIAWAANESPEKAVSFTGTEWHLTQVIFDGAVSALEYGSNSPVTIRFDKSGRVSGRGPINQFTGIAKWSDDGRIAWVGAGLQTTSMAGPPEAMEREDLFFQILGQVQRHRISGSQLILETDDSNSSLIFDR